MCNSQNDNEIVQTLSQNISQKVVNTLLKWFKEDATEGLEEVFTDIVNKVAQKLTYADKMTWGKVFSTEDAWDSFLSGLLLSRGMSGADAIIVNSNAFQNAGLEDIAGKLSRGEALSAAEQQRLLDAVLKNTAPDTAADSNQSSRVTEPGKFRMTGWDGRVAVTEATGPKVTVGGKTYELIGYDKDGAKVYQDAEVLKEQAEAESKQMEESESVSQEDGTPVETEPEGNPVETKDGQNEVENPENHDILTLSTRYFNKNDPLYEYTKKITPLDGFEDVVTHGDPISLIFKDADGKESNVSAEEFVQILKVDPNYKGGNIRLVACQVAADGGAIPKYIANALGVTVIAPTESVNVDWDGNMFLADEQENIRLGIETGEWLVFEPGKKGVSYDLYWKIQ